MYVQRQNSVLYLGNIRREGRQLLSKDHQTAVQYNCGGPNQVHPGARVVQRQRDYC